MAASLGGDDGECRDRNKRRISNQRPEFPVHHYLNKEHVTGTPRKRHNKYVVSSLNKPSSPKAKVPTRTLRMGYQDVIPPIRGGDTDRRRQPNDRRFGINNNLINTDRRRSANNNNDRALNVNNNLIVLPCDDNERKSSSVDLVSHSTFEYERGSNTAFNPGRMSAVRLSREPAIKMTQKTYSIVKQSGRNNKQSMTRIPAAKSALAMLHNTGETQVTARKTQEYWDKFVKLLNRRFEVKDEQLVRNILSYAKCLTVPNTSVIDKNTIVAQLVGTFGITDLYLIDRICYSNQERFTSVMDFHEFAKVVCIFASPEFIYKAMFSFNVYDTDSSDTLDMHEFRQLLRPCVTNLIDFGFDDYSHEDIDDRESKVFGDLISMLLPLFGKTGKSSINRFEWWNKVKREPMLAQCLGPCLPTQEKMDAFLHNVKNKTCRAVALHYKDERKRCLYHPDLPGPGPEQLYPVMLEFH